MFKTEVESRSECCSQCDTLEECSDLSGRGRDTHSHRVMCGYLLPIRLDSRESLLKNHQVSVCLSFMMDRKTIPGYLLRTTESSEKCVFSGPCQGGDICFQSSMSQQQMGARDIAKDTGSSRSCEINRTSTVISVSSKQQRS